MYDCEVNSVLYALCREVACFRDFFGGPFCVCVCVCLFLFSLGGEGGKRVAEWSNFVYALKVVLIKDQASIKPCCKINGLCCSFCFVGVTVFDKYF